MKMNINFWPWVYLIVSSMCYTTETELKKCLTHLTNYIKFNSNNFQVVIMINIQARIMDIDVIVDHILSQVPGLVINNKYPPNNESLVALPVFDNPRATSMFIVIDGELRDNSTKLNVSESIDFIRALSPNRIRPKCLILSFSTGKGVHYKDILRFMWSKYFLDVTVFQLKMIRISSRFLKNYKLVQIALNTFNPFIDEYKRQEFSQNAEWFPRKLKDMNGYRLVSGAYSNPPYSQLKFNSSGHLIGYSGADVVALDALSKALNFSTIVISSADATIGVINVQNNSAGSMLGKCARNEIDILLTTVIFSRDAKRTVSEFTRMINWENVYAIVPILYKEATTVQQNTLYKTFIAFVLVVSFIYTISRIFGFKTLSLDKIVAFLLGVTAEIQSTSFHERLVLALVIISGFFSSSILFAGMASFNLKTYSEVEFNTFEDLDRSGLIPLLHINMFNVTFGAADGALLNLKKKTKTVVKDCLFTVVNDKHKNISCLKPGTNVVAAIEMSKNRVGRPSLKALKEKFWGFRTVMNLGRASPYVERFNELIIQFTESGLRGKWNEPYSLADSLISGSNKKLANIDDLGYVAHLIQILIFVTLHGYLLSTTVFIIELLFQYFSKLRSVVRERITCYKRLEK